MLVCRGQHASDGSADCPENFWDGPTKDCLKIMDSVLDELVKGEWQMADIRINKTCKYVLG